MKDSSAAVRAADLTALLELLTVCLPLGLSIGAGLGLPFAAWGCALAAVFALARRPLEKAQRLPVYLEFTLLFFLIERCGFATAAAAMLISAVFTLTARFYLRRLSFLADSPAVLGLLFAAVLTVTVTQTNQYFGIGASGASVTEMLRYYRSLGFHPNWRGILYGTVVMVVMITFPRKFKKLSKLMNAAFLALLIAWGLNLLLIPADQPHVIAELGNQNQTYLWFLRQDATLLTPIHALHAAAGGAALWIAQLIAHSAAGSEPKTVMPTGIARALLSPAAFPVQPIAKPTAPQLTAAFLCSGLSAVSLITGYGVFQRIPLSACAVVLIVGAWQSVPWGKLKAVFVSPLSLAAFTLAALLPLLFGMEIGTPAAAAIAIIEHCIKTKQQNRTPQS